MVGIFLVLLWSMASLQHHLIDAALLAVSFITQSLLKENTNTDSNEIICYLSLLFRIILGNVWHFDLGSGGCDVFYLPRSLFNKMKIAKSADAFVSHYEFSYEINLYFSALLCFAFLRTLTFTQSYPWLLLWSSEKPGVPQPPIT